MNQKLCQNDLWKIVIVLSAWLYSPAVFSQLHLSTNFFSIQLDNKGFITSMKNSTVIPNREFSPASKPSPLLCLYDSEKEKSSKIEYHKSPGNFWVICPSMVSKLCYQE